MGKLMPTLNAPDYYRRRLVQASDRAERAARPDVRAIHAEFAQRYAELLRTAEGAPPALRVVAST